MLATTTRNPIKVWGVGPEIGYYGADPLLAVPDTTPPSLSSPTGAAASATAGNGSVDTDEANGTLYWVVTQSATTPSVAQIQAGQDHLGVAADASGSKAVSATGTQLVLAGGLAESTTYYFHFQQQDAATNDSTAVSSSSFTTPAAPTGNPGSLRRRRRWGRRR